MKSAFTMIELVFVIVILGILAAVAIPTLIDNKDNANSVVELTNLKTYKTEVMSYVLLNNSIDNIPINKLVCFDVTVSDTKLLEIVSSNSSESYCSETVAKATLMSLMDSVQL